jgi:hypothetical protein
MRMGRLRRGWLPVLLALATTICAAQQQKPAQAEQAAQADVPLANPARPTISTPAMLVPVGYVQFESGFLQAWDSPEFSAQSSVNEVMKLALSRRIEVIAATQPYAYSVADAPPVHGTGDTDLGVQAVVYQGEGVRPTIALSYFGRVYSGDAPDLDYGSPKNTGIVLFSLDVGGFHIDTDYFFTELVQPPVRRAQYGQTLSISHPLTGKFGLSMELWHFTQPFLRSNCAGDLWALNYNARRNLVFDGGFNRGLIGTSTNWEVFTGFTYVLPHRIHWR